MPNLELLCAVALLEDMPDQNLIRGQMGSVVELYSPTECEVEFCDQQGRTFALLPLTSDQLIRLYKHPLVQTA